MSGLMLDLRYALRVLRRTPGWTAVALLSLALGIGVNAAMFSLADAMFLRPIAVERPEEIVRIDAWADQRRLTQSSWLDYQELRATSSFSGVVAYSRVSAV